MNEFKRMQKLAGLLTEAQDNKITLDVKVGDKVQFYVSVPVQNVGSTTKKTTGTVIKVNPTTFIVKDTKGKEHKVSKTWHKNSTDLPSILKEGIYATPAFEKRTNTNREFPKWNEMTAEEIQTYIDENPDTLWGRDLGIAKMVRDNKLEQGELNENDPVAQTAINIQSALEDTKPTSLYELLITVITIAREELDLDMNDLADAAERVAQGLQ